MFSEIFLWCPLGQDVKEVKEVKEPSWKGLMQESFAIGSDRRWGDGRIMSCHILLLLILVWDWQISRYQFSFSHCWQSLCGFSMWSCLNSVLCSSFGVLVQRIVKSWFFTKTKQILYKCFRRKPESDHSDQIHLNGNCSKSYWLFEFGPTHKIKVELGCNKFHAGISMSNSTPSNIRSGNYRRELWPRSTVLMLSMPGDVSVSEEEDGRCFPSEGIREQRMRTNVTKFIIRVYEAWTNWTPGKIERLEPGTKYEISEVAKAECQKSMCSQSLCVF